MKKKVLALILAAGMCVGLLSGCTNNDNKGASNSPSPSSSPSTSASASPSASPANPWDPVPSETKKNFNKSGYPIVNDKITVKGVFFANPMNQFGPPEEIAAWKALEELTNIHIDWEVVDGAEDSAVELYFASGEFPDFFYNGVSVERQSTYGVEGGLFYDVAPLIDEYMPLMMSWTDQFPEMLKVIKQINGAIYTMPRVQKASTSAQSQFFYRTDYLEKVNKKTPTTPDELYDVLKAIKDAGLTKGSAPFFPYPNAGHLNYQAEGFLFPAFGESIDAFFADDGTGKVVYNKTSDQYRRYLEFMAKLYKDGLFEPEYFTMDVDTWTARLKEGKVAFSTNMASLMPENFEDGVAHIDCLAPLTSEFTTKQQTRAYDYVSSYGGAISAKSKYVEEIVRMFDCFYAKEQLHPDHKFGAMTCIYGVQGEDWDFTKNEDGSKLFKIFLPDDWKESQWVYSTLHNAWGQNFGTVLLDTVSGAPGSNPYARETGMMKNNIPFAVSTFPDTKMKYTSEESASMTQKQTDITSYVDQMRAKFITGVEPLTDASWDAYVNEIKKMGIEDLLKIKQAAYDRWNAD